MTSDTIVFAEAEVRRFTSKINWVREYSNGANYNHRVAVDSDKAASGS